MKKLLVFLLSLFLILALVACGPDTPPDGTDDPKDPSTDDGGGDGDGEGEGNGGEGTKPTPDKDPAAPDIDWNLPE